VSRLLLSFVIALGSSLAITPLVRRAAHAIGLVAAPRPDRWHQKPTAMLGGVAVYIGFLIGGAPALWLGLSGIVPERKLVGIFGAATVMFIAGLVDDKVKLRPASKLILQTVAAAILISTGVLYPVTPWTTVNVLFTLFWFLALTNAINLLDNMDGVAVGVGGIAASFLAISLGWEGAWGLAAVAGALAGSAFGFLPFNFSRASIFMGDSGSLFIGAMLAGLGAAYPGTAPASIVSVLFIPGLIVIIPILDTLLVTVARTLAGRSISIGGRDHTTHRLVAMGLSERQVAVLLYAFAATGGVLALMLRGLPTPLGLPLGAVFLTALLILAAYLGRMHKYEVSTVRSGPATVLISNLLHKRRAFEVVIDIVLFAVAYQVAYLLRWDGQLPQSQALIFAHTLALAVVSKLVAFGALGVYRGDWHHVSVGDAHRLAASTAVGALLTVTSVVFLHRSAEYSRSIFVLDALLTLLFVTAARLSFRSLDRVRHTWQQHAGAPTLIYGAGVAGELMIRELVANAHLGLRPVGIIDDDPRKRGRYFYGYTVLGGHGDLASIMAKYKVETIVLCSRTLSPHASSKLSEICQTTRTRLMQFRVQLAPIPVTDAIDDHEAIANGRLDRRPIVTIQSNGAAAHGPSNGAATNGAMPNGTTNGRPALRDSMLAQPMDGGRQSSADSGGR
jgi:UDP-GlcNAc:undecaprenyl-phosphate GlcNAc-1-phosphate transferase